MKAAPDDSIRETGVHAVECLLSDDRHGSVLIADEFSDVVFDTMPGFSKVFFSEVPHLRMSGGPFLRFGIERDRRDPQKIFADHLDPVLATLVILKRLPMEEQGVENRPCKSTTRTFHKDQFGADLWMLELWMSRQSAAYPLAPVPRNVEFQESPQLDEPMNTRHPIVEQMPGLLEMQVETLAGDERS
jgi:hypothetical protein